MNDIVSVADLSLDAFVEHAELLLRSMQLPLPPLEYVCREGIALDRPDGLWLEFGTGTGTTAAMLASHRRHGLIYTFDWFNGLPEDWRPFIPKGTFAMEPPTTLPENVRLVEGSFEDTLPPFMAEHPEPVDMAHIDCDIYASTKVCLHHLTGRVRSGTVLIFDELLYYEGREEHEAKALYEWLKETGNAIRLIGIQGDRNGMSIVEEAQNDPALKAQLLGPEKLIVPWYMPINERVALQIV